MKDGKDALTTRRRGAGDTGEGKRTKGQLLGLDIGYGHTKIVTQDGERYVFPSVVAAIAPTAVDHYGAPVADDEVEVDGIRCIVGDRAVAQAHRYSDLHDVWWITPTYKAVIAQASKFIPPQSTVITGLPLSAYVAPKARQIVHDMVKHGLKAKRVMVSPQGVGAYYSDPAFYHPTNKVAIVDIGNWTTEFIAISGTNFIAQDSTGIQLGVSDIYAAVAHDLKDKLGRVVDPYEVERASRGNGDIRSQGRAYAQSSIDDRIGQLAKARAEHILAKMVDLWGSHAPDFETVLFCGGGAQLLFPYLKSYRDGAVLMKDAQYSNALGFLKIGEWAFAKELATALDDSRGLPPHEGATDPTRPVAV